MTITGRTRLFAIIADPIAHVRTPEVFNPLFAREGTDAVLVPIHVAGGDVATAWAGFRTYKNLGGLVVTVPHKSAVAELCDELGEQARMVGAVNAVRREDDGRMVGDMFDGKGFVAGLRKNGIEPAGRDVLLVGTGGAGSAIAFALADAGVARLTLANRTPHKAEALAARIRDFFPDAAVQLGPPEPSGHDLIVNATSLGMNDDDPLPVDAEALTPAMTVAEIIMRPEKTALLAAAERRGCTVQYGRHMLDEQLRLLARFIGATKP